MIGTSIPWSGLDHQWVAHADLGAEKGSALWLTIPPGGGYPTHRHRAVERVVYVVAGELMHNGDGGSAVLAADESLVLPPGSVHGVVNLGVTPASVLVLYTPVIGFPLDDYEEVTIDVDGPRPARRKLHQVDERADISTIENGFENFSVCWDGAAGASEIVLGYAEFPPGGQHRWHRHRAAEEGAIVLSGAAVHQTDGQATKVGPGESLWIPVDQWHTDTPDPDCELLDCVWWYLGAATLEDSGYELLEDSGATVEVVAPT